MPSSEAFPAVVDCHQHVRLRDLVVAEAEGRLQSAVEADVADRRAMMAKYGIAAAVLLPSFDYDKSRGIEATEHALGILEAYRDAAPAAFPWLGCNVEPQHYDNGLALLDRLLGSGRFRTVTWHNRFHGVPVDAPIMRELVGVAARHGVPVLIHAAGNLDHEEGWRVARLVRSVPQARFLVLDGLMTLASTEVLTDVAAEVGNVWLDTANALPVRRVVQVVGEKVGWDRVVFGSCYYAHAYSYTLCAPLEEFLASVSDQQVRRKVLHDNLHSLFAAQAATPADA
jgi:uncharacterized protein